MAQRIFDRVGQRGGRADGTTFTDAPIRDSPLVRPPEAMDLDVGNVERGRHQVGLQGRGAVLACVVVHDRFDEYGADALGNAAPDLPVDHRGVTHRTAVLDHHVAHDRDLAGLRVDGHHAMWVDLGPPARRGLEIEDGVGRRRRATASVTAHL